MLGFFANLGQRENVIKDTKVDIIQRNLESSQEEGPKMELVKSRFENIVESDLIDGNVFLIKWITSA
jgi:hypothetical protein